MIRVLLWAALLAGVGAAAGLGVAKFTTPLYEGRATTLASTPFAVCSIFGKIEALIAAVRVRVRSP